MMTMMKRKPLPSPNATLPLKLTGHQQMTLIELTRAGDQKAIDQFLANLNGPDNPSDDRAAEQAQQQDKSVYAVSNVELGRQLAAQEDQLIEIVDGIGSLNEKLYELGEAAAKLPTRTMIEALSQKLDGIKRLILEQQGGRDHRRHTEWEDDEDG